jgi:hypothetical protein
MWVSSYVTCCLLLSSVKTARFVTAGTIEVKLYTLPLGQITIQNKFQSDLILGLATWGTKLKTQKVMFSRSQRSKFAFRHHPLGLVL